MKKPFSLNILLFRYRLIFVLLLFLFGYSQVYSAPSDLTQVKVWILDQRPPNPKTPFKLKLPEYPSWYGRCPSSIDIVAGFALAFKRECIDEVATSNIKNLGAALESTRIAPRKVRNIIQQCVKNIEYNEVTPQNIARAYKECNKAVKDIKEKVEGLKKSTNELLDVTSIKALASFAGVAEELVTTSLTCTLKSMLTSSDMTERQRQDVKEGVDTFLSFKGKIKGGIDLASYVSTMAVTLAENGLELFQSKDVNDLEDLLGELDKVSISKMVKENLEQFAKSMRRGEWGRTLTLEEKGLEIVDLMNSCQVNRAMEDLEIYTNMVRQEFLEQRWAITKAEKSLWCGAFVRKYEKMTPRQKNLFLARPFGDIEPNPNTLIPAEMPAYNPPRAHWYKQLDNHKFLIKKITSIYDEFSSDKIEAARREEKRERTLIKEIAEKAISIAEKQCVDTNSENYFTELNVTKRRLKRAINSTCGTAGLAKEYQLPMLVRILDFIKTNTEAQLKIRKETVDEVNSLLSFCKPFEANRVLEKARSKLDLMKPEQLKVAVLLKNYRNKDDWAVFVPSSETNVTSGIDGYDQCYASTFLKIEKKLKNQQEEIEIFLKKIDAKIQPIRRAGDDCNGRSTSYHLQNIRKQLTSLQCNSAHGISLRLKEIDLLETVFGSVTYPKITAVISARECDVWQRFWGYAHGCFTEDKIAKLEAEDGTTIKCDTECILCPKGFNSAIYNGSKVCAKCPKGKHFRNGCCR